MLVNLLELIRETVMSRYEAQILWPSNETRGLNGKDPEKDKVTADDEMVR